MKTKIVLLLSLFVISFSCYKEDPIIHSEGGEKFAWMDSLKKQGTNIYQQRLLDYHDKYSVLTMYQFDTMLFKYEINNYPSYIYKDAKEESVGALLDVIDELFYAQIGDKAVLKYTPRNILIVSDLKQNYGDLAFVDCYFGLNCITFSGADERTANWDKERKTQFKNNVVYSFTHKMHDLGLPEEPLDFLSVSNYISNTVTVYNYKELGFITFKANTQLSTTTDFKDYLLMAISTSTEKLNAAGGLFDPAVDKKGLIRKKYDFLVAYYKKYDIDLVKIADYQIK